MKYRLILLAAAALSVASALAQSTTGFTYSAYVSNSAAAGLVGLNFSVTQPINVTDLGFYSVNLSAGDRPKVNLTDLTTSSLLATAQVPPNLTNGFYYVALATPVTLVTGHTYQVTAAAYISDAYAGFTFGKEITSISFARSTGDFWGVGGWNFSNTSTATVMQPGPAYYIAPGFRYTTAPDPALVFQDSFNNGVPANSDTEVGAWSLLTPMTSTITEPLGTLVQTASASDTSAVIASAATIPGQRFNFFDRQLKFGATLTMGSNNAADIDTTTLRGRFLISSVGTSGFSSPDTLSALFFVANAVKLDTKVNYPNVDPDTDSTSITPKITTQSAGNSASFPYYNYTHQVGLTVNAKRYRLVSNVTPEGQFRARFTGEHGLLRSQWGTDGESSLILESIRTGATADRASIATWSNLKVAEDTEPMLNEPFWSESISFLNAAGTSVSTKFNYWIPSTEPVIRGMIVINPGDSGDFRNLVFDPMVQETARSLGFGVISYINDDYNFFLAVANTAPTVAQAAIQSVMNRVATKTGHPEICNAPITSMGFSRGCQTELAMAVAHPQRMITYTAHNYGVSPPSDITSPALKIPGLFVGGSQDANVSPSYMLSLFTQWRAKGAPVAFAIDWINDHHLYGNQALEAEWTWMIETTNLRYPRPMVPSTTPGQLPVLLDLPAASGWLGDTVAAPPSAVANPFITIAPYASYTGTILSASWYPNETVARVHRALTSTDLVTRAQIPRQFPLRITAPAQCGDQAILGKSVSIVVDPREFGATHAITSMAFYDGTVLLGTDTSGPDWTLSFVPTVSGLHSLTVVATDSAGNKGSAFRALFVTPTAYSPVARPQSATTGADAKISGALSATDPQGGTVVFSMNQSPSHGLLNLDPATGIYTYQPAHGYSGTDTFAFLAQSGTNSSQPTSVTVQVNPPIDSAASGLPDAWKTAHGVSDPNADPDGDGVTNLEEYRSLTNPLDPSDDFHIASINAGTDSGSIVIQWPAKGGVRYRVQYSDDLQNFTDIPRSAALEIQAGDYGVAGTASFTDDHTLTPLPAGNKRFYRVKISQ